MGSRFPCHQFSNGLYVSGRPGQPKERTPTTSSVAMPYTGGDFKNSGDLGKMFGIPADGSKSKKSGPITNVPVRSGSFPGGASHSGPTYPNTAARSSCSTYDPICSTPMKRSNSGRLNKHGEPIRKFSGLHPGGVTPVAQKNSGSQLFFLKQVLLRLDPSHPLH